jgi:hypothetical protein
MREDAQRRFNALAVKLLALELKRVIEKQENSYLRAGDFFMSMTDAGHLKVEERCGLYHVLRGGPDLSLDKPPVVLSVDFNAQGGIDNVREANFNRARFKAVRSIIAHNKPN